MNDPLSIQLHNRARFEQGEPGEWLKLPATADQLQEAMRSIGITAENRQDFFIGGIESPIPAVTRLTLDNARAAGVDELNYLAARLERLDPAELEKLNVCGDMLGFWDDVHQLAEYTVNTDFFVYIPGVTTPAQLGDYYLNKSQMVQMPEGWKAAVDMEKLGQLAAEQEKGTFWDNGYLLESGDEWEPIQEIPQEYRIMEYPQPEQQTITPSEQFGRDFAQTMQDFYKEHPPYLETTGMANTSPSFIAHQIEVGHTAVALDWALNALEAEPAYNAIALDYRQRLAALMPPQPELTAEEAAALAGERERALRDIGEDEIEPPTPFDMGGDPPIDYDAAPAVAASAQAAVTPEPAQPEPLPVKVITLESEKPADKLKEITDKLETGIAGIFESEQYADYLKTLSKFHDYSLNNTILIAMQKPDATHVAGFNTWKNEFERNVMKGQKGIKIIAPSPYKVKVQQEKTDPATGRPVIGADGKPVTEEAERKIPAYKVVSVFDVSQTEGKELPTIGVDVLTGDVDKYQDFFAALEKVSPVPVAFENIEGSANGYYHQVDKRIAIDEGMSELQTLKTTIHEIAHAKLHDMDAPEQDEQPRADKRTREVEAESIAYTVCQHYGLDTSDYSFGYVAGWSSGKELTELKASLKTIRTTAAALITEIDGHFAELTQDREQTAEQDAPAPEPQEPEQGGSVFHRLPTEQQQALSSEVQATLQFFVDSDLQERGELSAGTLEAIAIQGYAYRDGSLVKLGDPGLPPQEQAAPPDMPERYAVEKIDNGIYIRDTATDVLHNNNGLVVRFTDEAAAREAARELNNQYAAGQQRPAEQPPGIEEWSEPATPDNAPDNPGMPSDDIDAYLPAQGEPPAPGEQDEQGDDANPARTEPTPTVATYYSINEQGARRAKEAISFSDYKPGSATAEYRQSVDEAVKIAERQKARVDPMYHDKIDRLLDTYARKLAENMNHGYTITARVPSVMIAGPANFPVRAKEKQNAASRSNMEEWRHIQGLLDKIRSTGMGGISADDPNAVKKLQDKLSGLQEAQETMKAANAWYRKHKTLDGCPGLSADTIAKVKASMSRSWRGENARPFEPYALQNNNAEINRLKKRIEELQHREEAVFSGWQFDGGKVEVNKQDNRLQVFFDGKPDADTRTELKKGGFKWAPSVGAWQRQITANAFYAANEIKAIQPLTGEKPTDLQRKARREADAARQQPEQPQDNPATEQERTPEPGDTYSIYQLKDDDSTRDFRFEPYERLQAAGLAVDPANYVFVYSGQLGAADTLETIFEKFNIDRPADFTGHSLSVSDVVTLNRDGNETAHYVDSFGYKDVPEFLQPPAPALEPQQAAAEQPELTPAPEDYLTGDRIKTPRGSFSLADMTAEQMNAAGYGYHHSSDDGKYHIMANGTRAFAIVNPLRTAEMSTEQNYNMIDGIPNNTPSVAELEAKAKAGEQISLTDLANAIKAEKAPSSRDEDKKPSIREQLRTAREQQRERPPQDKARDKTPGLEV